MLGAAHQRLKQAVSRPFSCSIPLTCPYAQGRTLYSGPRESYHLGDNPPIMAPRNKGKFKVPPKQPARRPTHFICFPLVTDHSVKQLKQSLARFREVTMPLDPLWTESADAWSREASQDARDTNAPRTPSIAVVDGNQSPQVGPKTSSSSSSSSLRLLPAAAHRPPGTFHLTLGTMDLSQGADMERALKLLQEIDYSVLYNQAALSFGGFRGDRPRHSSDAQEPPEGTSRTSHNKADVLGEAGTNTTLSTVSTTTTTTTTTTSMSMSGSGSGSQLTSLTRDISPPPRHMTTEQDPHILSPQADSILESSASSSPPSPPPLYITLHSLGTFPTSESARVFWAHTEEPTGVLQSFGELIRQAFMEAGLITETRPLVLHATVANLIYVKGKRAGKGKGKGRGVARRQGGGFLDGGKEDKSEDGAGEGEGEGASPTGSGGRNNKSDGGNVDAREILKVFNPNPNGNGESGQSQSLDDQFIWASDIPLDRIRICKMGAEKCDIPDWGLEYRPIAEKVFVS